jgi:hypothetical protein
MAPSGMEGMQLGVEYWLNPVLNGRGETVSVRVDGAFRVVLMIHAYDVLAVIETLIDGLNYGCSGRGGTCFPTIMRNGSSLRRLGQWLIGNVSNTLEQRGKRSICMVYKNQGITCHVTQ